MGAQLVAELDAWLCDGGLVVTASDRATRAVTAAFHRARRAQGLSAWAAPRVQSWKTFVRAEWDARISDSRLVLNPLQERALWSDVIGASHHPAAVLESSRLRLAELAMDAHELLCAYRPQLLDHAARTAWMHDAAAFSGWLAAFDESCAAKQAVSGSRIAVELIPLLALDASERPAVLLAGFDRLLPIHERLFQSWGEWREIRLDAPTTDSGFYEAPDPQAELDACARWCRQHRVADPHNRILVVTQDARTRRGEIERAFLRYSEAAPDFEFSLGVPLRHVALVRSAHMLLRWLDGPLDEQELDWLFSTGYVARKATESAALQACMRALRRRGLERTQWPLKAFLRQRPIAELLPVSWAARMAEARQQLHSFLQRDLSPLEWAGLVQKLLKDCGWPGGDSASSAEFQAAQRWQQVVDTCGSLAFDGRRMRWNAFLAELGRALDETLFAPESEDAPIVIAGPAESAGLTAEAIWFLGADEDAWPARGSLHPLLPFEVQREAGMPHASPQLDWTLAEAIANRLLRSTPEIRFSYARQREDVDNAPSRLIVQIAGAPQPLPAALSGEVSCRPLAAGFVDAVTISAAESGAGAEPMHEARGGATVLTYQSQCPFKAFATARLDARGWAPAEAGLSPAVRGQLLHGVLHAVWSGPPEGIRTFEQLASLRDRRAFVQGHVSRVMDEKLPAAAREQMPRRYLELEERRLTKLITEWLDYESTRIPFSVARTEVDTTPTIAGLTLKLRLDRVDRLSDGTLLVIDYKTGDVTPRSWDLPRPDDVQLPLYAGFALEEEEVLGGLAFAKVRAGDTCFAGLVGDPKATLFGELKSSSSLMKHPLTLERLLEWRDAVEQLARDFLAGRADVDPRERPQTCARCGLQTLCRIQERELNPADDEKEEAADE